MNRKSMKKCGEGVSPVVGTILMVAMTVVLAAILYVMITNVVNPGTHVTPIMSTSKTIDNNNTVWTIAAISGNDPVLRTDVYVQLKNATGFVIETEPLVTAGGIPGCSGTHGFMYRPANAGNYISVGDTFSLDKAYTQGCSITLVTKSATSLYTVMTV